MAIGFSNGVQLHRDSLDIYYKSGDSYILNGTDSGYPIFAALLTTGATDFEFSVQVPFSMKNVTPKLETLKVNVRIPTGGYLYAGWTDGGNDFISLSSLVFVTKINDYLLGIAMRRNSGWGATNNIPLAMNVNSLKITFS